MALALAWWTPLYINNVWIIHVHKKTSCSALSMLLQHVKELIEIVFQLISVTKVQHFGRALSVSVRLCPNMSEYVCFCPFVSVYSYRSMPYCSAMYFTATGGSSLSRGFTPNMASSSLWRDSHLWKVLIVTPAFSASWAFDMDFIFFKVDELTSWRVDKLIAL